MATTGARRRRAARLWDHPGVTDHVISPEWGGRDPSVVDAQARHGTPGFAAPEALVQTGPDVTLKDLAMLPGIVQRWREPTMKIKLR